MYYPYFWADGAIQAFLFARGNTNIPKKCDKNFCLKLAKEKEICVPLHLDNILKTKT